MQAIRTRMRRIEISEMIPAGDGIRNQSPVGERSIMPSFPVF